MTTVSNTLILNSSTNTLSYAIQNPLTFITSGSDWYTDNLTYQNNILWSDGGIKGIYNPCPKGWTIPSDGAYEDFLTNVFLPYIQGIQISSSNYSVTNGRLYNQIAWYPSAGYYSLSCSLSSVGYGGFYWLKDIVENNAARIFYTPYSVTHTPIYRGNGYPIRCVQE